tara:strand:- start:1302 stop:1700 length:399 start_codon:yes stop_codon:yes gene_type:complete
MNNNLGISNYQFRRKPIIITALIDIIFLLLLFFMLSSTFTKFGEIKLDLVSETSSKQFKKTNQFIFVRLSDKGLTINGSFILPEKLIDRISKYKKENSLLILSVVKGATSQSLVKILYKLKQLKDLNVRIVQ